MRVILTDVFTGKDIPLTVYFTTNHPASSYGQKVMMVDEWDDAMSHQNWVLSKGRIVEANEEEQKDFKQWYRLIRAMNGK